jgi:PAS domain S-box-containing protein
MNTHLHILHLEDSRSDADLIRWELKKAGLSFDVRLVDTREDFLAALSDYPADVILSDHSLPSFDSLSALQLVKERSIQVPFILVTATVSEEYAVKVIKLGAWDYVLKDRLQRLPSAILNSRDKYIAEQEQKRAEELLQKSRADLRTILDNAKTAYILIDSDLCVTSYNQRAQRMALIQFGRALTKGEYAVDYFLASRRKEVAEMMYRAMNGEAIEYEISYPQPDGTYKWFEVSYSGISDDRQKGMGLILSITDINERKIATMERDRITADLIRRNRALEQFTFIVSHNLRAPVASILGIAYLFRDLNLDRKETGELVEALGQATRSLDNIVTDLNDVLQVTQHESELETEVDLAELVESIKSGIGNLIERERIHFECEFSAAGSMRFTRSGLYSILYNLTVHSIKYKDADVPLVIRIGTEKSNDELCLKFSYNGSPAELEKRGLGIFSLRNRVDDDSSGMGMFLIKTQVDMHNGRIEVKKADGGRTEFTIIFPLIPKH